MAYPGQYRVLQGYDHTITTITSVPAPDPYMIAAYGKFYLRQFYQTHCVVCCATAAPDDRTAPPDSPYTGDVWAPELHALRGRWWVYFSADDPKIGNSSHRMFVLGGPPVDTDPCAPNARWDFIGPLQGLPNGPGATGQWAIDLTVITLHNVDYVVYSGWPWNHETNSWVDRKEDMQQLWIARMRDPTAVDTAPVMISNPEHPWEYSGSHGVNEGPQWLQSPDGRWQGLVYSCAGAWTNEYKMNTLRYTGGDPLHPQSWQKSRKPLITSAHGSPPYGPGHGNFVHLGNEVLAIFHATDKPDDGFGGRKARCQKVAFLNGEPYMGEIVGQMLHEGGGPALGGGLVSKPPGIRSMLSSLKQKLRD